ncbi:MAG: PTS sugar transporter subunit IIA [Candidatus Cloacimonetes bacterium]|nr:PTS sugar transporter subunit IIA [Candidatus Cloacimonadota bacterium]
MVKILKISELLNKNFIIDLKADNKKEALEELLNIISNNELITDKKRFSKEIFAREKLMSTGIGYGIAIPHARHKSVKDFVLAIGRKKEGISYESIDDKPIKLIFMIGASDKQDKDYIKLLSRLVLRLKNHEFVEKLLSAKTNSEMYDLIKKHK